MYKDLLSTFSGQLSLGIIVFVILMGAYLALKFVRLSAPGSKEKDWV
jgi:hypothetical protein